MSRMIFVNLPVSDLEKSKAFYTALGYTINPQFSDETAACVVISDTIYLMILTHPKFESFLTLPRADTTKCTAALIALSCEDRTAVDKMTEAALKFGGAEPKPAMDHGFMYTRTFMDPDGNIFEPLWMDPSFVQS